MFKAWFATSVSCTPVRSAARNRISLITTGQASASTHIFTSRFLAAQGFLNNNVKRSVLPVTDPPPLSFLDGDGNVVGYSIVLNGTESILHRDQRREDDVDLLEIQFLANPRRDVPTKID